MVFVGAQNAPAQSFPSPPDTTVDQAPVVREKPFLYVDDSGAYNVFVPDVRKNVAGTSRGSGDTPGTSLPISRFSIAKPGDSADHSADPTTLSDVFFRVGGAGVGKVDKALVIDSNNVITDDMWIWRADHGDGVGFHDLVTVSLGGGPGSITHVINNTGDPVGQGATVADLVGYPN